MDNSPNMESRNYLTLDSADHIHAVLSNYAGKIARLLSRLDTQANPDFAGSLDDLLGAVYALLQAKQHGFTNRTSPIQISAVEKRAQKIAEGKIRLSGKWIAGFYFNNALFRIAAVYHRVLKIIVGGNDHVPVLVPKARRLFAQWTNSKLAIIHREVNDLKHTPRGVHDQRMVTYDDAVAAAGELLSLIEQWASTKSAAEQTPLRQS